MEATGHRSRRGYWPGARIKFGNKLQPEITRECEAVETRGEDTRSPHNSGGLVRIRRLDVPDPSWSILGIKTAWQSGGGTVVA